MTKVFISYSRKDKVFAAKLKAALDAMGLEAWIDWIDIPPTADWWDQIQKGIEASDAFLFLLSPDATMSAVCTQEIDYAIKNGKRLIPLIVRDTNASNVHPVMRKLNWIFFRNQDDFETSLKKLERGIKTDLAWVEFHRRLQVRGVEWEKRKDNSLLLRGKDLRQAEEQLSTAGQKDPLPTDLQRQYVLESRRRESRTRNGVLTVGAIVIAALVVLSVFAINQRNIADSNAVTAIANQHVAQTAQANSEEQERISSAGELSAQAVLIRQTRFDLSLLLSIEAFRKADTLQSRGALLDSSQANPQLLQYMHGHNDWVDHISFSPDGKTLISGSDDGTIIFWDIPTQQRTGQLFTENAARILTMILGPDGKTLVSAYSDGKVVFWDVPTQQAVGQVLLVAESSYTISSMDFSPDGKNLALGTLEGPILFWDIATRQAVGRPFDGYINSVSSIDFSPDGETLVSGSQDGTIVIWDVKTRQSIGPPLKGYTDFVIDIAFSPNGKFFLSGSESGHALLWDITTGQSIEVSFSEPTGDHGYRIFDFSPDGQYVAFLQCQTVDREGWCIQSQVILWNIESRGFIDHPLQGFIYEGHSLAFSPDGKTIAAGSCRSLISQRLCARGNIILWDIEILHPIGQLFPKKGISNSHSVTFSPDGKTLASANFEGSISLWDVETQQKIKQIVPKAADSLSSIAFSSDGKTIAAATYYNSRFILWELATDQSIYLPVMENSGTINGISFSPNGPILAAVDSEGNIILWDLMTDRPIGQLFSNNNGPLADVDLSPDGRTLASGDEDGGILLWDLTSRRVFGRLFPQSLFSRPVVAFSPNGSILASGYSSGSIDGVIILWDLATGQPIGQPIIGDRGWNRIGQISDLDFSPDGKFIISASNTDGQLILWDMDPRSWMEKACIRSGRNFSRNEWVQYLPNEEYRATCAQWPLEPESP